MHDYRRAIPVRAQFFIAHSVRSNLRDSNPMQATMTYRLIGRIRKKKTAFLRFKSFDIVRVPIRPDGSGTQLQRPAKDGEPARKPTESAALASDPDSVVDRIPRRELRCLVSSHSRCWSLS